MKKSALIIDDHPIYRDALAVFTRTIFDENNITAVSSSEEGLAYVDNDNNLALILLDLELPGLKGIEAVTALKRKFPAAAVIVISASDDRREVDAVLRAGAKAFVSKSASTRAIADIMQKVLAAEPLESPWVTHRCHQPVDEGQFPTLTPRQREALVLLCKGFSNKEIGLRLGLAEITVKMHVSSIFRILGVVNRTQASLTARRFGLYVPEEAE